MRLTVLLLLLCGCAGNPPPEPQATSVCLNRNILHGASDWQREAAKRWPHSVLLIAHGFKGSDGQLWISPDFGPSCPVEPMALLLRKLYPAKDIVLIVCNGAGVELHSAGVHYAMHNVFSVPNRVAPWQWIERDAVGSIWAFR